MALHYDFPYTAQKLYCNKCKQTTTHTLSYNDMKCETCGHVWDGELLRVTLKQDRYGKLRFDCIIMSEKPVNSTELPVTSFTDIDQCVAWLRGETDEFIKAVE